MKRQVLVVSHADADGHVIAEQVRRNLESVRSFEVSTIVDPQRTRDHKAWLSLESIHEIEQSDLVVFVDLMFSPTSFATEAEGLVRFARERPAKTFFVIDHHPLPLQRLTQAANVRAVYRDDVFDCAVGPSSWMMIIAALCEKQPTRVGEFKKPVHDVLAKGLRRAAALGGPLAGEKLLTLLRFDRWSDLEKLGREDSSQHWLPRGRRPAGASLSTTLTELDETASRLLKKKKMSAGLQHHGVQNTMAYDFAEGTTDYSAPQLSTPVAQPQDLEAIVTLLELAAMDLSALPGTEFTFSELLSQANEIGGGEITINEKDAMIVLEKAKFVSRKAGKRFCLK